MSEAKSTSTSATLTPRRLSALERNVAAGILALLLAWLYSGSVLDHGYIYDDQLLIESNPRLVETWGPLKNWADPLWHFPSSIESQPTGFWRPFTLQVLAWSRAVSGGEAWGPHLFSLVIHWLATLAGIALAIRLGLRPWLAWGAGFLFALHPVQVQSVAWAASINDPLIGLFSLLALGCHLAWVQQGRPWKLICGMLCFALALLSKEQAAAVLPIAGLILWWGNRLSFKAAAYKTLPLVAVLLVYYGIRVYVFDSAAAGLGGAIADFRFEGNRAMEFRGQLLGGFASMLVWPAELPFFRGVPRELAPGDNSVWIAYTLAGAWILAIAGCLATGRRMLAVGLAMPFVWLAPQIWIYDSAGAYPQSDRYLYVPVFGFVVALMAMLGKLRKPMLVFVPVAVLMVAYTGLSRSEVSSYKDNETFFRTAIEESPNEAVSYWSLGRELLARYKIEQEPRFLDEAMLQYWTVLTLGRDYGDRAPRLTDEDPIQERLFELEALIHGKGGTPPAYVPLTPYSTISLEDQFQANMGQGWVFTAWGQLPPEYDTAPAVEIFEQVTTGFPDRHECWIGLASAYLAGGEINGARAAAGKAVDLLPSSPEAWFLLGEIQRIQGEYRAAANSYREARKFRPYSIQDHLAQIGTLLDGDQIDVAEYELKELDKEHASDPRVRFLHGMMASRRGQWERALNAFDRVLAVEPLNVNANLQRGKVLIQLNRTNDAVAAFGKVCELDSKNFEAHSILGEILITDPSTQDQARAYLERAYQLGRPSPNRMRVQDQLARWIAQDENALMAYMQMDEGRGDYEACLRWIELLLRVPEPWKDDPNRQARMATVQLSAGSSLAALGQTDRALQSWRESIELKGDLFWSHHKLGTLLYDQQRFIESLPHLQRALQLIEQVPAKEGLRRAFKKTLDSQIQRATALGPEFVGPPLDENSGENPGEVSPPDPND